MDQEGSADSFLRDVSSENTEGKAVEEHSEKQYPGCRRNRICRSMWLWLSFFSMGLANSQRGPAFLDIQMITGTTLQQAASFFTASFVGSVVGSLLGGVVYDVISQTLFLGVSLLAHAVLTMLTPFCRLYALMAAVSFLVAVFGGGVSTAVNADVLRVWEGRGGVAMQGLHFSYALGGVIAPLITQPFLAPRDDNIIFDNTTFARPFLSLPSEDGFEVIMLDWKNASGHESRGSVLEPESPDDKGKTYSGSYSQQQGLVPSFHTGSANATSEQTPKVYGTQVHFAYMISAVTTTISALPFLWMHLGRTKQRRRGKDSQGFCLCSEDVDGEAEQKITRDAGGLPVGLAHVTLAWTCVFFVLYYAVERSFVSFLPMFVVQHLRWTKADASLLTSVFWTSLAMARFLSIFLVRVVSTVAILTFCCAFFVASLVGMLLVSMVTATAHAHWSVWMCVVLSGAASAGIVPTTLSWVEDELLCVTGRTLAVIAVTSSLGSIANPLLLGFLIEHYGALWFWYILLGEATASAFALLLLLLFSQLYLRPRFGSRRQRKLLAANLVVVKVEKGSGLGKSHGCEDSGNCAS